MFIYNVTIKVDESIHAAWLEWMKGEHIDEMIGTGCFIEAKVCRLLEVDDSDGPTYAVQFVAESKGSYNRYIEHFAPAMRQKSFDKWGNQFIAFRSVMQVVN
ncbi:MAG: DUF4286 family protein [Ferruginibacter sp.]